MKLRSFQYVLFYFLIFLAPLHPDNIELKISLYTLDEGEGVKEVTHRILEEGILSKELKRAIKALNRRFFVFSYPSNGMQIKSMISFVDKKENQPLIVVLRGASRMESLPAFLDDERSLLFAAQTEATIILGTYRDGVSPGVDEYGGEDVEDVKSLTDFLPEAFALFNLGAFPKQKYLIGLSRGGMQLFLALSRFPELSEKYDAVVSLSGILNIETFANDHPDWCAKMATGFGFNGSKEWLERRNPINAVSMIMNKNLPILIVQGTRDPKISTSQGLSMVATLQELDFSDVTYWEIEEGDHCLKNHPESISLILDWLNLRFHSLKL